MHLGISQNLKLTQELRLTPMMIQSMEILQLQLMQLQARINQELESNPVLELTEELTEVKPQTTEEADSSPQELEVKSDEKSFSELESLEKTLEPFDSRGKGVKPNVEATEAKYEAMQNTAAPELTLQQHLENQLRFMKLRPRDLEIAEMIIYSIDDDGYLRTELSDIQLTLDEEISPPPTEEEILDVIEFIQNNCEPVGVAARNLKECLLIQMGQLKDSCSLSKSIVEYHLDDLINNRLPHIAKSLDTDIETINQCRQFLQLLNPKPGLIFGPVQNSKIIPDIIITEEEDGSFRVRLENSMIPEIRISGHYYDMLDKKEADAETLNYVKSKVESARWLIDSIHQRHMTILKITNEIIKVQEDFLRQGVESLKCLRMQDIADQVGVHVSTVSRAISGKYVQCPQGIFPMKKFFTGGNMNDSGISESHHVIHNRVKEIVNNEDRKNPLSDDEIVHQLRESGITLARRTVAKYRKLLKIPPARLRRTY